MTENAVTPPATPAVTTSEAEVPKEAPKVIETKVEKKGEIKKVVEPVKIEAEAPKEAKTEETPPPAKKEKKAPALAKIKAREEAAAAKEKEVEAREAKIKDFEANFNKEAFRKNPTKFLAKYDLTFQDVAEAVLNEDEPETPKTDAQLALEKIAELEKKAQEKDEAKEKEAEENKQAYIDRVFTDYRKRIVEHIDASEDKFELIKLNEKQELVLEIQQAYYAKHNKILELDQACEIAENHLLKSLQKIAGAKKLQQFFAPPKEASGAKTLSSNLASATSSPETPQRTLSKDERIKRAAEKLQFAN